MKKLLFVVLLCVGLSFQSYAESSDVSTFDNVIYVNATKAFRGSQILLSVKMKNNVSVSGFQADLYLPQGVTVAKDEDDFPIVALSEARTTSKKTDYFNAVQQNDGALRILCSSTKGYVFDGTDGEVATIALKISDIMAEGDYPIVLKKIELSDVNSQSYKVELFESVLSVSATVLGDINGDGEVTVSDMTSIANIILYGSPLGKTE